MNILIVDDNIMWLQTLKRGLKIKGYDVLEAMSSNDALKNLSNHTAPDIDLVLTDYFMPGMNGIELLKAIRKNHEVLPVVIMTAYNERVLPVDAVYNHCNGFIVKPFTLDQLMQEIKKVMK